MTKSPKSKSAKPQGVLPDGRVRLRYSTKEGGEVNRIVDSEAERDAQYAKAWQLGEVEGSPEPFMMETFINAHEMKLQSAPQSVARIGRVRLHIVPAFGDKKLFEVDSEMIMAFAAQKTTEVIRKTVGYILRELKAVFAEAIAHQAMTEAQNPFNNVQSVPIDVNTKIAARQARMQGLALPSLEKLAIMVNAISGPLALPFLLMVFAGLRLQEIVALRWKFVSFDHEKKVVLLDICEAKKYDTGKMGLPKTSASNRFVEVGGRLYEYLRDAHPGEDGRHLFVVSGTKKPEDGWRIRRKLWDFQVSLGLAEKHRDPKTRTYFYPGAHSPHDFRHACVALWIWSGMGERDIMTSIGHDENNVELTFTTYGYLFDALDAGLKEWPVGPVPMGKPDTEEDDPADHPFAANDDVDDDDAEAA